MTVAKYVSDAQVDDEVINLHVGRRLRRRRRIMGLTQAGLGSAVRIKFQQVQKYECAANRMSAARLFLFATALRVPVQFFFEGLFDQPANDHRDDGDELAESNEGRDILELYYRLSPTARPTLIAFMKSLSEPAANSTPVVAANVSELDDEIINLHIGRRLRRRRKIMGMTQECLGSAINVKFQQVQKYECATNRISAARLFLLAAALHVPVQYFFEGLLAQTANDHLGGSDELAQSDERRDVLEVYYRLSPAARKRLIAFMKSLSEPQSA